MGWPAGFDAEAGSYAERSSQQSVLAYVPVPACAKLHPAGVADDAGVRAGAAPALAIRSIPRTTHAHAATRQARPHSVDRGPTPTPDSAPHAPFATWRVCATLAPLGCAGKSPGERGGGYGSGSGLDS